MLRKNQSKQQNHTGNLATLKRQREAQTHINQSRIDNVAIVARMLRNIQNGVAVNPDQNDQLMALMMVCLIGGAYAANAHQVIHANNANTETGNKYKASHSTSLTKQQKTDFVKAVCSNNTLPSFNKPNVTLAAENGVLIAEDCFNKNPCDQSTVLSDFYQNRKEEGNYKKFLTQRDSNDKEYKKWQSMLAEKANLIYSSLTREQQEDFQQLFFIIGRLKQAYLSEKVLNVANMGNCAEKTNFAMKQLLLKKLEFGLKLKIQSIEVNSASPTNKNKVQDHRFLLLDSDLQDQSIKNDKKAVKKLLNNMKSGIYCDPWEGFSEDVNQISKARESFYLDADWHSMTVKSIEIDFRKFNSLPLSAQKLVCDELKNLGFPIELQPSTCTAYWNSSEKNKSNTKNGETTNDIKLDL